MIAGVPPDAESSRRRPERAFSHHRAAVAVGLIIAALAGACAPKTAPVPPSVAAAKYPEFVFPAAPPNLGTPAAIERHKAGWEWLQAGDFRAADRNFTTSLKLSPDFYPAEAGLGYSALARKDNDEAVQHFDRAIVANPRYVPALTGRGDALLALGHRDEALKSFEAALAADPTLTTLRSRIEVLRFRGMQEDVADARKAAENGKLTEARRAYQEAIAASPQSPFLYRELAIVERKDNDLASALVHAQKAAELEPAEPKTAVLIGELLEARGEDAKAIAQYEAALKLEANADVEDRVNELREKAALAALPPEYQTIEGSPGVTRAQLAALIGVRLEDVLRRSPLRNPVVITDTRGHWAAPWILSVARTGVMEVYPNHTFQPSDIVRRGDLAQAASRLLGMIGAEKPALAASWRVGRRRFLDVSQGHLSYPAVALVVEARVMNAFEDGSFQLTRPVTGAEAAAAVKKLQELAQTRTR